MKFKNRKLYAHGQNPNVFTLQLPKLICEDMQLSKDTTIDIDYSDYSIVIKRTNEIKAEN